MRSYFVPVALALTCVIGKTAQVHAQAPPPMLATIDPEARALLSRMVWAYKTAASYSDTVEWQVTGHDLGLRADLASRRVTLRLNKGFGMVLAKTDAAGTTLTVSSVAEGHDHYVLTARRSDKPREFARQSASSWRDAFDQANGAMGTAAFGSGNLFSDDNKIAALLLNPALNSVSLGRPETLDGTPVETVIVTINKGRGGGSLTFSIGKGDSLLRRMVVSVTSNSQMAPETVTETHHDIKLNADKFSPSVFDFVPPKNAHQVSLADLLMVPKK